MDDQEFERVRELKYLGTTLKPGIDCARLPHEAMFIALPRKVNTMLLRAAELTLLRTNLARVEPNRSGSLSGGKGISVCCALSDETVLWLSGVSFVAKWRMKSV